MAHSKLILLGDFNITVDDRDTYDAVRLRETIHHTTQERQHFQGLIDRILVSQAPKPLVTGCVIDKLTRKNERPSDHTPVVVTLS